MYNRSSLIRREFASLRLALLIIVAMALWHRAKMSSSLGESFSWSTSVDFVRVYVVCWGSTDDGLFVFRLGSIRLAVFLSRGLRFSHLVMGGCSLVMVSLVEGWAIGHICVLGNGIRR